MMTLPNIGLMGRMRSGKDEAARYLAQQYGYMRFAFGDELKRYAHELFGESERKPRELYQWFGQTMRQRDPDVWVRMCFADIDTWRDWTEMDSPVVITDCRQPNEYAALKSAGYVLIRIECPDALRIQRAIDAGDSFTAADLAHDTETALDGYSADFTVHNGGTLGELHAQIDEIMSYLSGEWPE